VKDRNGKTKVLKGFHRLLQGGTAAEVFPSDSPYDPERIYALVNDEDFVLVQYFQLGRLLVSPEGFIK
jgi:hypothetical protein